MKSMWHKEGGHKSRWDLIKLSFRIRSKLPKELINTICDYLIPYAAHSHESAIIIYFGYNENMWQPYGNQQDNSNWRRECNEYLRGLRLIPPYCNNNPEVWFFGGDKRIFFKKDAWCPRLLDEAREDQSSFKEQYLAVRKRLQRLRTEKHSIDGKYLRNTGTFVARNTVTKSMNITLLYAGTTLVDVEGVAMENFFVPNDKKFRFIVALRTLDSLNDVFVCLLSKIRFESAYNAIRDGTIKTAYLVDAILLHNERCDVDKRIGIYDSVGKVRYASCPTYHGVFLPRDIWLSPTGIQIKSANLANLTHSTNEVEEALPNIRQDRYTK